MEHVKKFLIIFAIVLFVIIFAAILLNKYPLNLNTSKPVNVVIPTPIPNIPNNSQTVIVWNRYNWTDPASGTIKRIPYPSDWIVQENFNRIDQIAGVFIHPNGALGDDRISIGGYGVAGGQFLSSCADIRSAESNQVTCYDSGGITIATKSNNPYILRVFGELETLFPGSDWSL